MCDAQSVVLSRTAIVFKECLIHVFDIRKAAFQTDRQQVMIRHKQQLSCFFTAHGRQICLECLSEIIMKKVVQVRDGQALLFGNVRQKQLFRIMLIYNGSPEISSDFLYLNAVCVRIRCSCCSPVFCFSYPPAEVTRRLSPDNSMTKSRKKSNRCCSQLP